MSIPVRPEDLQAAAAEYGFAYLLTVNHDGRPHAVAVTPAFGADAAVVIAEPGRRSAANAAARPNVSLLWPPSEDGGYSLIADGDATVAASGALVVMPTTAVRHRPAPAGGPAEPGACGSDCRPVTAG